MNQKTKFIYIAGYGRSGSTLLDLILANHEDIFGVGELTYLFDDYSNSERKCACGEPYSKCVIWSKLSDLDIKFSKMIVREIDKRRFSSLNPTIEYKKIIEKIDTIINEPKQVKYILDSSKSSSASSNRISALKECGYEVKVIHLKRSLFDTIKSITKGSNWSLEGHGKKSSVFLRILRTVFGWNLANYYAYKSKFTVKKNNYIFLKYNDFVSNPENTFQLLSEFLHLDLEKVKEQALNGFEVVNRHNVGGNRLRAQKFIKLERSH